MNDIPGAPHPPPDPSSSRPSSSGPSPADPHPDPPHAAPPPGSLAYPHLRAIGLTGVLVDFSATLDEASNRAALAFRHMLETESWPGVEETATSLTSVFVRFDPAHVSHARMKQALQQALARRDWYSAPFPAGRRLWSVPAVFGGEHGPQLAEAAALAGLDEQAAIDELAARRTRVLTLGFAPGQPYLGELPRHWDLPRQDTLTARVPAGALVVAIRQLVLFSFASPTGWRHIAQTAFRNFRPQGDTPFVLHPGDELRFVPVSPETLANIRARDQSGNGGATSVPVP